jgi:hypothetical protein
VLIAARRETAGLIAQGTSALRERGRRWSRTIRIKLLHRGNIAWGTSFDKLPGAG